MKQIFDWLREQISDTAYCEDVGTCGYCQRTWCPHCLVDRDDLDKIINEAEAKWKPQKIIKTYLHPRGSIIGDCPRCENGVLAGSKFCRFCGIPLEVE